MALQIVITVINGERNNVIALNLPRFVGINRQLYKHNVININSSCRQFITYNTNTTNVIALQFGCGIVMPIYNLHEFKS